MAEMQGSRELNARLTAISSPAFGRKLMGMLGLAAVREQKLLVHRKTGVTGRSIHVGSVTDHSVTTEAAAAARWLEFGTKAHLIKPKHGKMLRWAANASDRRLTGTPKAGTSDFIFARVVHHPGTKPYPFMLPGARIALQKAGLLDSIVTSWNNAA